VLCRHGCEITGRGGGVLQRQSCLLTGWRGRGDADVNTYVERAQMFLCPEKFRRTVAKARSWFIMPDT